MRNRFHWKLRSCTAGILAASLFYSPSLMAAAQCSLPMFAAARAFDSAGDSAWFAATGDFNGDGKADVAVANFSSGTISVMLGNGDGTLQPAVKYNVGVDPSAIVVADFNGDGKLDLAVASTGCAPCSTGQLPGGVWILKGNGDGTFASPVNVLPGSPGTLTVADFNHDGKPDLALAGFGSSVVEVLLGNGDMTFKAGVDVSPGDFTGNAAAVGDVNGDGKPDIVSVDVSAGNILTLLGKGDGTFKAPITSGTQTLFNSFLVLALGDFNGDGKLDVVSLDSGSNYIQVWMGNGDGTFKAPVNYTVGTQPSSVVVADFNGDGRLDLAISDGDGTAPGIAVLLGNGNGTFQTPVNYVPSGNPVRQIAAGDFNGDGRLDFVATSQVVGVPAGVWIVLGNGNGTFQTAQDYPAGMFPQGAAIGDLNGDGIPDVVGVSNGSNTVSVLIGNGDGTFKPAVNYPVGLGAFTVAIADINGDGKPDIATANVGALSVSVLLGNGDGTFKAKVDTQIMFGAEALAAGDFNKDGKADLAVLSIIGVVILLSNGDGTFQAPASVGTRSGLGNVVVADLNGDGNSDLVVANTASNTVSVFLGNGNGTFASNVDYTADTNKSVQSVSVGDLNGDGKPDLVVADFGCSNCTAALSGNIAVLMGNGDGTFQTAVTYNAGNKPQSIAIADFNGDGFADLAVTNFIPWTVSVLLNHGDGTFGAPSAFGAGNGTSFITVGDLNGDGKPDLVTANGGSSNISVLLNNCSCSGGSCVSISSAVHGASFAAGVSSGQWVTIKGNSLASGQPAVLTFVDGSYPTSSNGVSVTIGGLPAFLYYLSPGQLNVVSPDNLPAGNAQVIVTNNGVASAAATVPVSPFAPAFFTWPGEYAVATDQNFQLRVKAGEFSGLTTKPAAPGDVLILWGTGFGPSNPPVPAGHEIPSDQTYNVANAVQVTIGGMQAQVYGAAYAPGFAALVQVAVQVPNLSDGDYPVIAEVGGASSPSSTLITIKK
jgi:uncharacterized protein (TIGR03437 family)